VLVVDDDAIIRRMVARLLCKLHCTCEVLEDGDEVEARLQASDQLPREGSASPQAEAAGRGGAGAPVAQPFTCILMDINMRRSRGDAVSRHLKQRGLAVPIYPCTANTSAVDLAGYVACGMEPRVLSKPFTLPVLAGVVQDAWAKSASAGTQAT
jgi:CheY-like chemotaxis protein